MAEILGQFLLSLFGSPYLSVIAVSMFPLIELKGAIPIGTGSFSLPLWQTAALAYVGSTVIFVLVFFLLIPIFNLLKKIRFIRRLVEKIESIFRSKAQKMAQKSNGSAEQEARRIMMWSLFAFVAVPFPVTGVWTGTAIAVFLGMKFRHAALPIALGNLVAGSIITLLTYLVGDKVDLIIYVLFAIALLMLTLFIIKVVRSKPETVDTATPDASQEQEK